MKKLVVGLTGTFGSGKTSALKVFRRLGAKTINSDQVVREIYTGRHDINRKIAHAFGLKQVRRSDIARIVFWNQKLRKKLERLIHPFVFQRIREVMQRVKKGIIVIEMPLLFEVGFHRHVDRVVVVSAGRDTIGNRLKKKGFSKAEVSARQKAQWSLKRKERKADFIIRNTKKMNKLINETKEIWKTLRKEIN